MQDVVDKSMKKVAKYIKSGTPANMKKAEKHFNKVMNALEKKTMEKKTMKKGGRRNIRRNTRKN